MRWNETRAYISSFAPRMGNLQHAWPHLPSLAAFYFLGT